MRVALIALIVLSTCLFTPGCTGADEELVCDTPDGADSITLTQYDYVPCEFTGSDWTHLSIEMTSTGDSPVHIFTFTTEQYDSWLMCEDFDMIGSFSEEFSTGASMEGEIEHDGDFYVVFDHPNSCDEEDASTPVVEFSFKVVVS
tara:strand:- start:45 stop:479 length:435 start_codon:yes stop_codon:yes gene_type:complete